MRQSALHYCAEHGHASVAEVLIRAGANVNAVNNVNLMYNELKFEC